MKKQFKDFFKEENNHNNFKLSKIKSDMEEQYDWNQLFIEINTKLRDMEEKQRTLSERLLLIGQNMIEQKEENNQKFLEIKKEMEISRQNMGRVISFIETISGEFSDFARKEDVEILARQAKMFQPLMLKKGV